MSVVVCVYVCVRACVRACAPLFACYQTLIFTIYFSFAILFHESLLTTFVVRKWLRLKVLADPLHLHMTFLIHLQSLTYLS